MAGRDNAHSRVVAWLKIVLPLTALALLSTIFLFSKNLDTSGNLPFSDLDILDRAAKQQITAPYFSGTTANGETISIVASAARPDPENKNNAIGESVDATLRITDNNTIRMTSDDIRVDSDGDIAIFRGAVEIVSTTGYRVRTEAFQSSLAKIDAETLDSILVTAPAGHLTAGHLKISSIDATGDIHLLFTEGVKLVYKPGIKED